MPRHILVAPALVVIVAGGGLAASLADDEAVDPKQESRIFVSLTGRQSEFAEPGYRLAATQEVFDEIWVGHMGDRVERAAQGWPMTPRVDFDACAALFVFGGDGFNANGYRVLDVIDETDAVTVRYERISYQTASFDGADHGDAVRPWALFVLPATERTLILEENVQGLIGGDPIWKQRAAFPGRPVPGTRQR